MDTEHNVHEENQVAHERLSLATLTETERLKDDRRAATDAVRAQVGEAGLQIELLELKNWRRAGRSRPLFLRFPRLAGRINKFVVSRLLPCNLSPILSEDQTLPPWPVSVDDRRKSESAAF